MLDFLPKELLFIIMNELDAGSLMNIHIINKNTHLICNDKNYWTERFKREKAPKLLFIHLDPVLKFYLVTIMYYGIKQIS